MKSKSIALGGILSALSLVILYLTNVLPLNTLALLTLTSGLVAVALIRTGVASALLVYTVTCMLSFFMIPPHIFLMYLLFFGSYSIIKALVERIEYLGVEWLIKFVFFNIVFFLGFNVLTSFINPVIFAQLDLLTEKYMSFIPYSSFLVFWILGQVAFILFDYALTLLIEMYYKYVHSKI